MLLGDEATGLDLRGADRLRRAVAEAVAAARGRSITDVVFTADAALAAPTNRTRAGAVAGAFHFARPVE